MAIISNSQSRKMSGRVGGLVYRVHDGVTIVSEAPARKKSGGVKSANQIAQSLRFSMAVRYARERAADIRKDFQRDKLGTPHSKFLKLNMAHIGLATEKLLKKAYEDGQSVQDISSRKIEDAVKAYVQANPNTIYRTYRADSHTFVAAEGWAAAGASGGRGELKPSNLAVEISKTERYKRESAGKPAGKPNVGGAGHSEAPDPAD